MAKKLKNIRLEEADLDRLFVMGANEGFKNLQSYIEYILLEHLNK